MSDPTLPMDDIFQQAVAHHQEGRLAEAEALYRQLLRVRPDHVPAQGNLGLALAGQGRLDEALTHYRSALVLAPDSFDIHYNLGIALQILGKLGEAIAVFQSALVLKPDHADAYLNLGTAFKAQGRLDDAVIVYQQALVLKPNFAEAHNNLGNAYKAQGRLDEAVSAYQRALTLNPDFAEAYNNLGNALNAQGKLDEAVIAFERALALNSDYATAHYNLGGVLQAQGKLGAAVSAYQRALALNPNHGAAYNNLGNALNALGRLDEAVTAHQCALALNPDHAAAHNDLGNALSAQGKLDEAVSAYQRALALNPNVAIAYNNLGSAFHDQGKLDEALIAYEQALSLNPYLADAYDNLGSVLNAQGRLDESLARYRRTLELEPGHATRHRHLLTGILYHPGFDAAARFAEHLRFARMHAPAQGPSRPHSNPPDPRRKLRLGYVSADLRGHSTARVLIPLVEAHDRSNFELFFYADVRRPDDMTARFRALADGWRITTGRSDAQVAEAIRADNIDILVCLAGHFDGNRPLVAAHRPAPVQLSYLDPATSGLAAMEYLIADPILVPRRSQESFVERVVRLPTYWVAQPIDQAPPVVPPPARESGVLTFGCLNNPSKITDDVLKLWGALMDQVPESKLLLKYRRSYASVTLRERVQAVLGGTGVAPERIIMRAENQDLADHLALYGGIDVALDPFPFCGATATFEALWMGVPVVTLAGEFMVGRWSASMLSALGLPELVAATPAEYIAICRRLAADPKGLAELRAGLRARVAASRLCDAQGRARQIERLYRALWRRWCARRAAGEDL